MEQTNLNKDQKLVVDSLGREKEKSAVSAGKVLVSFFSLAWREPKI